MMRRFGTLTLAKANSWPRACDPDSDRRRARSRVGLRWETLEKRELLTTAGNGYVLSGFRWSNPGHITYSIAPDGVNWDLGTNTLNTTFNARFGNGVWQREIARALATWESAANINISLTSDSFQDLGTYGQPQGDPRFGDLRFGGTPFRNNTTTLAQTYFPPPQGTTEAGDIDVNLGMNFTIGGGGGYDLYNVVLHETGHSLGLDHSPDSANVMYADYGGVRAGLGPGDIAGIQAIYGARTQDAYQARGQGVDGTSAIDVTPALGAARQATVGNVALATIGDTEYFSVVAPNVPGLSLQVTAAAGGVSLLSPKVTLYDASGNVLDVESNAAAWSDNVLAHVAAVVPGQRYLIAVTGATSDVFAVGAYQLQVAFTGGPPVVAPPIPTPVPPVAPPVSGAPWPAPQEPTVFPDRFESNDTPNHATQLGLIRSASVVAGLTLTANDVDQFVFAGARAGIYQVAAAGTAVRIFDASGHLVASGAGQVAIQVLRARTPLFVQISAPGVTPVANYALGITTSKAPVVAARHAPRPRFHAWASAQRHAAAQARRHH